MAGNELSIDHMMRKCAKASESRPCLFLSIDPVFVNRRNVWTFGLINLDAVGLAQTATHTDISVLLLIFACLAVRQFIPAYKNNPHSSTEQTAQQKQLAFQVLTRPMQTKAILSTHPQLVLLDLNCPIIECRIDVTSLSLEKANDTHIDMVYNAASR
ncbi:hypothetical protein CAPTEDRAFT_203877 [Capitella teleta]|uniref:Uncharacterized protein n=1 Tax=Capitella teleta TaxID=283909 RepID=R7UMT7_CAPTE|nr:hypothetical protein CAPTEDRAFT_203877 [Capitella teleta]|eukprot:ELU07849.1 hypothetical protein CAPTEDRAFT_203877 [Capitella teleta]